MNDRSRIDRTVVSDFGNIRDEENEDDNEFFAPINGSETESCESPAAEHGNHNSEQKESAYVEKENVPHHLSTASSGASTSKGGLSFHQRSIISEQPPSASSNLASNRYANNLSKITEAAEEFSFSFKHGDSARRMLDENQELLRDENYLRLPDSFHASRYSVQNSWDAGSCSPFHFSARPQLDLSVILVQEKSNSTADNSQNRSRANTSTASPQHSSTTQETQTSFTGRFLPNSSANISSSVQQHKSTSTSKHQQHSSVATGKSFSQSETHPSAPERPMQKSFISGNRHSVFFGFRRPDFSAEEILIIRNIHPEGKPIQISCTIMGSHTNCFTLDYPDEKVVRDLQWDNSQRIVILFTPSAVNYFKAALYIHCSDSDGKKQKFNFLLHGYGGRAIVNPYMEDRFGGRLLISSNGRCQLIVRSLAKFDFGLKNLSADRAAFACLLIQGRNGAELSPQEVWASPRHVVLGKGDKSTQTINIRYLKEKEGSTPRPSSAFSTATSTMRGEPALKIIVIWGEERMRQRLKQFEKKKSQRLTPFGFDFLTQETFLEEQPKEDEYLHVNEEDLFYLVKNMKLCFIDVYQNPQERPSSSSTAATGSSLGRVGSALSIASSSGLDMRAHQTIIEVDPDNTMVGNPVDDEDQDDDTLTQT